MGELNTKDANASPTFGKIKKISVTPFVRIFYEAISQNLNLLEDIGPVGAVSRSSKCHCWNHKFSLCPSVCHLKLEPGGTSEPVHL